MNEPLVSRSMKVRLTDLTSILQDETLSDVEREALTQRQVEAILSALPNELIPARQPVLNYLTLLGFGDRLEESVDERQ